LKAQPQPVNGQRGPAGQRGPGSIVFYGGRNPNSNNQNPPTDAQLEQNGARRMLAGLQQLLPQIDQYLPRKAQLVRQEKREMGMSENNRNIAQAFNVLQQGNANVDTLMQVAAMAPPGFQSRMYQQAAYQALDEGNVDRARQIATDHLQSNARDVVLQRIDFREM